MEHDFKVMHEQLTSEIKLLNGKLNSLEEFRSQREELMNKFLVQEAAMEEQEKRHKEKLYEEEKKFIVGKYELKKDMESKLLQLSLDFQNTTDIRIASTTQRVIRENVAINNELKILMESWKKLKDKLEELRKKEKAMRIQVELHNNEKTTVMKKNSAQTKIIEQLTNKYDELKNAYSEFDQIKMKNEQLEKKVVTQIQEIQTVKKEAQLLKQTLNARDVEENEHRINLHEAVKQISNLKSIIQTAAKAVTEAIGIQEEPGSDTSLNLSVRGALLTMLLKLFNTANEMETIEPGERISLETISVHSMHVMDSFKYSSGDLGLIPKPVSQYSRADKRSFARKSAMRSTVKKSALSRTTITTKSNLPQKSVSSLTQSKSESKIYGPSKSMDSTK